MKTHQRWRESINEKMYFRHTLHEYDAEIGPPSGKFRPVNFHCAAPEAASVHLVGDFNHWQPAPMEQRENGWWFIQVWLAHGRHCYRFLVDSKPVLDPHGNGIARDEHGEPVSLMAVS